MKTTKTKRTPKRQSQTAQAIRRRAGRAIRKAARLKKEGV